MANDGPVFVVLNRGSGKYTLAERRAAIARELEAAGRTFEIFPVGNPAELSRVAARVVKRAQREQGIVVAAGGDGTINAVAQAVLGSGRPLGVLPQGTFNFTGRAHAIPLEPGAATRALLAATPQPVQVGLVNDRVFLVNASLGLYPHLLQQREDFKRKLGRSRVVALFAGLFTLLRHARTHLLALESDRMPGDILRTPALIVVNNLLQLETMGLPEAEAVKRGELAAIVVKPVGAWSMVALALRGLLGRLADAGNVRTFAFPRMAVRPRRKRWGQRVTVALDGEIVRLSPPLVFRVSPQPLDMLVPPDAPDEGGTVKESEKEEVTRTVGLIGAAEGAPLSQGRDGSFPLELEGDDLAEPPESPEFVRGEPTEPAVHAPTTTRAEALPVATGERTIEDLWGRPLADEDE